MSRAIDGAKRLNRRKKILKLTKGLKYGQKSHKKSHKKEVFFY